MSFGAEHMASRHQNQNQPDPGGGCERHRAARVDDCAVCQKAGRRSIASILNSLPSELGFLAPRTAHDEKRDRVLTQLLYAARRLAEGQIVYEGGVFHCYGCGVYAATHQGRVKWHREGCAVGVTLALLGQLQNIELIQQQQREETAPKGDDGGAGDGLRPPVNFRTPWTLSKGIRTTTEGVTAAVTVDGVRVFDLAFHELSVADAEVFARRIVLCINTCSVMTSEALEKMLRIQAQPDVEGADE